MHCNRKYKYEYIIIDNYIEKLKYFSPNPKHHRLFNLFSSCYLRNICHMLWGKSRRGLLVSLYHQRDITVSLTSDSWNHLSVFPFWITIQLFLYDRKKEWIQISKRQDTFMSLKQKSQVLDSEMYILVVNFLSTTLMADM